MTSEFRAIVSGGGGGVDFFVAGFCVFRGSRWKFARVEWLPVDPIFEGAMALAGISVF